MTHFWQFFFFPPHEVWYKGAVWGNVVAVLPLAILGAAGFAYHHVVVKGLHSTHDEHLKKILDALDPEAQTETQLDQIADRVDETTPGGLGVLDRKLDQLLDTTAPRAAQTAGGRGEEAKLPAGPSRKGRRLPLAGRPGVADE